MNIKNIIIGVFPVIVLIVGVQSLVGNNQPDEKYGTRWEHGISADSTKPSDGEVRGTTFTSTGEVTFASATVSGTATVSGALTFKESTVDINTVGNTTHTIAQSGTTFLVATGTTSTLPAATDGLVLRFLISGAFDTTNFIIDSAEGDNIEGALIVAGAVVDCDAEDQINFVADGENLGDYIELRSDGTSWFIGSSGALTAGKLTCTDPS